MIYRAKKDWWLAGNLAVVGLVMIGFGIALPFLDTGDPRQPNPAHPVPAPLAGLLVGSIGMVPLWMFVSAGYEIAPPDLGVPFGPVRRRIPLWERVEAVPKRTLTHDWGWGMALSLDRLRIKYRKASGRMALPVIISPADRDRFLAELAAAAPRLHFTEDGALRLATEGRTGATTSKISPRRDHAERGEVGFLVVWDREEGGVWYDILAFSRPRHLLARRGYPLVRRIQERFRRDSARAMQQAVGSSIR